MHEISRCDLNKGSSCGLDFLNKSSQITLHGGHILVTASGSRQLLGCASAWALVRNRRGMTRRNMEWRQSAIEFESVLTPTFECWII